MTWETPEDFHRLTTGAATLSGFLDEASRIGQEVAAWESGPEELMGKLFRLHGILDSAQTVLRQLSEAVQANLPAEEKSQG